MTKSTSQTILKRPFANGEYLSQIEVIRKTGKIIVKQRKSSQTDKMYSQIERFFQMTKIPFSNGKPIIVR